MQIERTLMEGKTENMGLQVFNKFKFSATFNHINPNKYLFR